jgi:heterodisulfide reductase subunit C
MVEQPQSTPMDINRADPLFIRMIEERFGKENINSCFSCRTCVSSCPVTQVDIRFNPLKIIRLALYGLKEQLFDSAIIWLCSSCYSCQERCPKGVKITDFMIDLKNMAFELGYTPSGIKAQAELIMNNGKIYPLDDFDNKKRAKINLPELPTTCDAIKELFE